MKREHPRDAIARLTAEVEALRKRLDAVEQREPVVVNNTYRDEAEPHEHKPPRHGPDIHLRGDP